MEMADSGEKSLTILQAFYDPNDAVICNPEEPLLIHEKYGALMSVKPGHIPAAKAFPLVAYSDLGSPYTLTMPSEDYFRKIALEMDLRLSDTFVCYDAGGVNPSCRLAWTLKGFGAKNVHVLNGTLEKWIRDGGDLSTDYSLDFSARRSPVSAASGEFDFELDKSMFIEYTDMTSAVKQIEDQYEKGLKREQTIIDTKPPATMGVPAAHKLPFTTLFNKDKTFRSEEQLKDMFYVYGGVGDPREDKVILSCQIGLSASTMCVAFSQLGNRNIRLYDGSYEEWESRARE